MNVAERAIAAPAAPAAAAMGIGPATTDAPVGPFRYLPADAQRAQQVDRIYEALRVGDAPVASQRPFPGLTSNVPTITDVHHPSVGTLQAVVKPPAELAAQEVFVHDLARRLGISHLYAQVAPRPDGSALIEIVPGETWKNAGIADIHDLDRAYGKMWDHHRPLMPASERAMRARVDRELVQFVDWLAAQGDRSPNNGLFDDRRIAVQLFDHGRMGAETPWNKLRPWLPYPYMGHDMSGRVRSMELSPQARAIIAERLGPDELREAHTILRDATRTGMSKGQAGLLRYLGTENFLGRMTARRSAALTSGTMEYVGGGTRTAVMNAVHAFNRLRGH